MTPGRRSSVCIHTRSGAATRPGSAITATPAGSSALALCSLEAMIPAQRIYQRMGFVRAPDRDWEPLPGAQYYQVQVSTDDSFFTIAFWRAMRCTPTERATASCPKPLSAR